MKRLFFVLIDIICNAIPILLVLQSSVNTAASFSILVLIALLQRSDHLRMVFSEISVLPDRASLLHTAFRF